MTSREQTTHSCFLSQLSHLANNGKTKCYTRKHPNTQKIRFKMQVFTITFVLIVISRSFVACNQEEESIPQIDFLSIDRSNYVDPHDMLNYDRRKGNPDETVVEKTDLDEILVHNDLENLSLIEEEKEVSDQMISSVKASKLKQEHTPDVNQAVNCLCLNNSSLEREKPFLGRFVTILSRTLQLKVDYFLWFNNKFISESVSFGQDKHIEDGDVLHIPLLAAITKRTQFVLSEIVKEGGEIELKNLADLDEVLSNLFIVSSKLDSSLNLNILETILNNNIFHPKV